MFTYEIPMLESKQSYGDYSNVVSRIHYKILFEDKEIAAGAVNISPPSNQFISFEDLTKDKVISWLKTELFSEYTNEDKNLDMIESEYLNNIIEENKSKASPNSLNKVPTSWSNN